MGSRSPLRLVFGCLLLASACSELRGEGVEDKTLDAGTPVDGSLATELDGSAERDAAPDSEVAKDASVQDASDGASGPKRVFVTDERFSGALALAADTTATQIVARIDGKCQAAAEAATLGGTWKAWISASDATTTVHAIDHIGQTRGPFYRLDGKLVFVRLYDTTSVAPLAERLLTEKRTALVEGDYDAARVWTGTGLSGRATSSSCEVGGRSWRYSASDGIGTSGTPLDQGITGEWTISGSGACNTTRRLYCFEN